MRDREQAPVLRFLSSTRLAIALCLILAAGGIAGSVLYNGNTAASTRGSGNLFHSPVFLLPAFLLILNVACCAFTRLRAGLFHGLRAVSFIGLHAGLLLLAAGLIVDGRYAFVGTQYYRIGEPSAAHFDWRDNNDRTFPFTVEVTGFSERYHPMKLQVGIKDAAGKKIGPFMVREGVSFKVPGVDLTVTPRRFDIREKKLTFDASSAGREVEGVMADTSGAAIPGGFLVVPVAWADPEVAEFAAKIRFAGVEGATGIQDLRVNHPAYFGGVTFCLSTSYLDAAGGRIVGLQMTREPGAPCFWSGAFLFGVSLLAGVYRRRRESGRKAGGDEVAVFSRGPSGSAAVSLVLVLLLTFAWAVEASAFGRAITADETWEGEVKIVEPVSVEKGATLTIRAGTVVLLSGADRGASGCPDGGIQVYGKFRVEGTQAHPVRFSRLDPSSPWNEIFIKEADAVIRYAVVEGATWGLHIHDGDVSIERTTLRGNGGGARLKGTGARFERCTIRDNGIGLRFWDGGPRITSSSIAGNRTGLFYRDGRGGGKIKGSRIENLETDAKIGDWAKGDLDLTGNYWGGRPKISDYRGAGAKGKVRTSPILKRAPAGVGAD